MPAPLTGYQARLVSTRVEDVAPDVVARFLEVCAAVSAVEAGYVCRQEITVDHHVQEERLGWRSTWRRAADRTTSRWT